MPIRSLSIEPTLAVAALIAATAMIVLVLSGMANIAEIDVADLALAARGLR